MKKYGFLIVGIVLGISVLGTALASSDTEQTPDVVASDPVETTSSITPGTIKEHFVKADTSVKADDMALDTQQSQDAQENEATGDSEYQTPPPPIIGPAEEMHTIYFPTDNPHGWKYILETPLGDFEPAGAYEHGIEFSLPGFVLTYKLRWEEL